jgi:anaerobic magnesium-protoporphyrin IX monomethyl ester cyclase
MSELIDCLIIGHNEMNFEEYENIIGIMGKETVAYKDLSLNFINYKGKPLIVSDVYNMLNKECSNVNIPTLSLSDTFSTTIAYLGTYLSRRGISFDYINSFQNEKEILVEKLKSHKIRSIAITTTLYVSALPILEILELIRKYDKSVKIIIGGPYISTNCRLLDSSSLQYLLKSMAADFYINSSQGETALTNIVLAIKNNSNFDNINNIYYKDGSEYKSTLAVDEDNKLDDNMVEWGLFSEKVGTFAAIRTAISCPFSCMFCGFPKHAGKYQTSEVKSIEKELNAIERIGTVKSINFIDDTFNVPNERFKAILKMMIKNKYSFKWHSYFRCQYSDRETIELMKESGCEGVFLGIESGSQEMLNKMNKQVKIEKYIEGHSLLKEYDILTFDSFIIGFPGENENTVKQTIEFIRETKPTFYRVQVWYCEPITPIWEQKDKYEIKGSQFQWEHSTMDSLTAFKHVEEMFFSIKDSIWLPQYNFDFINIFHLLHRGMSINQIKEFLTAFNIGLSEKLKGGSNFDISENTYALLKKQYATK